MIESKIEYLLRSGPLGWCLLGLTALTALGPLLLVLCRKKWQGRGSLALWAYCIVGAGLVSAIAALASRLRHQALASMLANGPDASLRAAAEWFEWGTRCEQATGLFVLVSIPLVASVVWIRRLRASDSDDSQATGVIALVLTCATIAWPAALGLFWHARSIDGISVRCPAASCYFESWIDSFETVASARTGVVASALVASAVVPLLVWLRPLGVRSVLVKAAAMLGASCALWAYCLVRPLGRDAQQPLPFTEDPPLPASVELPEATRCEPVADAPIVMDDGTQWLLDGQVVAGEAEFGQMLATKRELWKQLHPKESFPGIIEVLLDRYYSGWEAGKIVRIARTQGYRDVRVGVALPPRAVRTRTAGNVAYRARWCAVRLSGHVAWMSLASWGDVVERAGVR